MTAEDKARFERQAAALHRVETDDEGDPQWRTDTFEAIDKERERRGLPPLKTEPEFHRLAGALGLLRRG